MTDICKHCNKPILDGEVRYTGGEHKDEFQHWDCHEHFCKELDRDLRKFGQGAVADELEARRKDPLRGLFRGKHR